MSGGLLRGTHRRRAARFLAAALIALSASVGSAHLSVASPTREEVERAESRLDALNRDLSLLVEHYNQARIRLQEMQTRLGAVRGEAQSAERAALHAIARLNASAARAYQGLGPQFAALFDATSLGDFSDRLEFIDSMAQADADLATEAESARQEAEWRADELREAVAARRRILDELEVKREQIAGRIAEAKELFEALDLEYREAVAARRAAQAAAAQGQQSGGVAVGPSPLPPPPAPNGNVQAALDAAYSMVGTPYQWGGSSPETGFDCSGFTMWAWAHAGVYLPHSSAVQFASLPHVARDDLRPGDLVFFYNPVSHVGIYVGGGSMIDSPHTGTVVQVRPIYWDRFTGAARPG